MANIKDVHRVISFSYDILGRLEKASGMVDVISGFAGRIVPVQHINKINDLRMKVGEAAHEFDVFVAYMLQAHEGYKDVYSVKQQYFKFRDVFNSMKDMLSEVKMRVEIRTKYIDYMEMINSLIDGCVTRVKIIDGIIEEW